MIFVDETPIRTVTQKQHKWDLRLIGLAREVASWYRDPSSKHGCVLVGTSREVLSMGYNGLARGVSYEAPFQDQSRLDRPEKYHWFVHAEENAVANAARVGACLSGATAYVSSPCCAVCMRMLLQAGVMEVVVPEHHDLGHWAIADEEFSPLKRSAQVAADMAKEVGVTYRTVGGI